MKPPRYLFPVGRSHGPARLQRPAGTGPATPRGTGDHHAAPSAPAATAGSQAPAHLQRGRAGRLAFPPFSQHVENSFSSCTSRLALTQALPGHKGSFHAADARFLSQDPYFERLWKITVIALDRARCHRTRIRPAAGPQHPSVLAHGILPSWFFGVLQK